MTLKSDTNKKLSIEFWSWNPVSCNLQTPKKLDDRDVMALRYVAMDMFSGIYLTYEGRRFNRDKIEEGASICDNELYLNEFQGYRLAEHQLLKALFMNEDRRIIAEVWTDEDNYEHYIVY